MCSDSVGKPLQETFSVKGDALSIFCGTKFRHRLAALQLEQSGSEQMIWKAQQPSSRAVGWIESQSRFRKMEVFSGIQQSKLSVPMERLETARG